MGDVIVVGTGVVGMAIAVSAADAGYGVCLVGPGPYAQGAASGAAGAMLGVLGEHTAVETDPAALVFRYESARLWPRWLAWLGEHAGVRIPLRQGTVIIANLDHAADRDNLEAIATVAGKLELPVQDLDPREVPGLEATPRHAPVAALVCPEEGWVDTDALLAALCAVCRAHPRVRRCAGTVGAVLVSADDSRVRGVRLGDGSELTGDQVVLAAGAGTQVLVEGLGLSALPRVLPARGVSLLLDVPAAAQPPMVIRTPNRDFACGLHVVPRDAAGLYVGATNRFSVDAGPTAGEQLTLLHGLLHQFRTDLRGTRVAGIRWGHRPASSDGAPLIGPAGPQGLHLATGTYRNGILMAPAVAAILIEALGGTSSSVSNPYSLAGRAARRQPVDLGALLSQGAEQMSSVLLDPDGVLPFDRQAQLVRTLDALLRLAIGKPDTGSDQLREQLRARLTGHPTVEGVCGIFDTWETRPPANT